MRDLYRRAAVPVFPEVIMGFATDCIHAGQEPDPSTGAIITPIFQTSTYVQEGIGKHKGYEYARTQNPTRRALERNLAALEGGVDAYCYASGMAATQAVLTMVKAGQRVVVSDNVYGGTHRLFTKVLARYDVRFAFLDATDTERFDREAGDFAMLWIETPTNPLMKICDIRALSEVARKRSAILVVDNTFMSPFFQRPLGLGADIVVHSTTKFLNGHSDSVGGVAVTRNTAHAEWLQYVQNAAGAILSPFDSWLVLRGTKTLALRMARHEENGRRVAEFLRGHPKVRRVHWPGFADHPGHEVHRRQASGFGAMIAFDLGDREAADRLLRRVRLCSLGESLGGIETLISHPATMTHAGYTQPERDALGIGDGLVRISVGCEDSDDLLADLRGALDEV
jgi:cystathionine beta-lyase/cystathionine gamma-synthase